MTKYARLRDGHLVDVYRVPGDFADVEMLNRCLPGGGFITVPDDATHGAADNGDGTYTNPPAQHVLKLPRILSKTGFQDYAISRLGGGIAGMTRFTEIMDATAASPVGAVRFAFARYEAADKFEKENTATLTQIMAGNGTMTAQERSAILDNWPEA